MITALKGILVKSGINRLEIETGGVTREVTISYKTHEELKNKTGETVYILVYHLITEQTQRLFGFLSEQDREFFIILKSLSGIGPATAMNLLSFLSPRQLYDLARAGDTVPLKKIPKVGAKTAESILFAVKQNNKKFEQLIDELPVFTESGRELAVQALVQLGFDEKTATRKVEAADSEDTGEIIRIVLQEL